MKKDYHWIKIDHTKYWNADFLKKIGPDAKLIDAYVFDHNSATYASEITPSYALYFAGTEFTTSRELTDDEREDIEEQIRTASNEVQDVEYHHCSSIDNRTDALGNKLSGRSRVISQFVDCDDDVTIDDVIEYYQGNPW